MRFACRAATGFIGVTASFESRSLSDDADMVLEADVSLGGFECCIDNVDTANVKRQFEWRERSVNAVTACRQGSWGQQNILELNGNTRKCNVELLNRVEGRETCA